MGGLWYQNWMEKEWAYPGGIPSDWIVAARPSWYTWRGPWEPLLRCGMEDVVSVRAVEGNGVQAEWEVEWKYGNEEFSLAVSKYGGGLIRTARGPDLFDAFCEIRRDLEGEGVRICVSGARIDAYPSGMAREMGGGQMVYLLRRPSMIGKLIRLPYLRPRKLVYIFSPAPCHLVATVDEQEVLF